MVYTHHVLCGPGPAYRGGIAGRTFPPASTDSVSTQGRRFNQRSVWPADHTKCDVRRNKFLKEFSGAITYEIAMKRRQFNQRLVWKQII
jgi:hypothetical protein